MVSHLSPTYGGIAASLPSFCEASEREGTASPVVGFCDPAELEGNAGGSGSVPRCMPPGRLRWMVDARLRGELTRLIRIGDGVHIHGLWETHCAVGASLAHAARKPYIISAHGMLERWALKHKRLKKALYATLIETENLRRACCLRALTPDEAQDYRRIGLTNRTAIVPGAVDIPAVVDRALFRRAFPELNGKRIVLFLGRLHIKKGPDMLIHAWRTAAQRPSDAHLVIAGPDFDAMRPGLEKLADDHGVGNAVTFAGMLNSPMKWSALANAHLFVLPSFSEGFSIAVLEAMGMGLPVIVTPGCHFPEVAKDDCGWVTEPNEKALSAALSGFFQCSSRTTASMGSRGRDLVNRRFTWNVVGEKMARVYEWAMGGNWPNHVETI